MRMTTLPLALVLLSTGCVDATGIFSDCSGRQAAVIARHGPPDRESEVERSRGDYLQTWDYFDLGRRYIFRWGDSYDGCQEEQTGMNLIPDRESPLIPEQD